MFRIFLRFSKKRFRKKNMECYNGDTVASIAHIIFRVSYGNLLQKISNS